MFDSLKKLVYDEVPDETPSTPQNTPAPQYVAPTASPVAATGGVFSVPQPVINTGAVDQKFLDHFQQLFDSSNLPGVDYYEFRKSLDALAAQGVDDKTKFNMVFSILSSTDKTLTKQHLIDTANQYVAIMSQDKDGFAGSIAKKKKVELDSRQTQIDTLTQDSKDKTAMIAKLTQQIQDNNNQTIQLQNEMVTEGAKIDQSEKNFEVTYQLVVSNINGDVNSLNNYLV